MTDRKKEYRGEDVQDPNMSGQYERPKYGSPTFYKLLEEAAETHNRKSHDYATNDNPYGNYHFAGLVSSLFSHSPEDAGFVGRIAEKIFRLSNLERDGKIALNESVRDTETDIVTITALWMSDRRDRRDLLGRGIEAEQGYQPEPIAHSDSYMGQTRIMEHAATLTNKELIEIIQQLSLLAMHRDLQKQGRS